MSSLQSLLYKTCLASSSIRSRRVSAATGFGTATAFARIFHFGTHGTATTLSAS